jgi:hypothetical protein
LTTVWAKAWKEIKETKRVIINTATLSFVVKLLIGIFLFRV